MYLKRKVDIFLKTWKNKKNKNPLIIRGARQIGKTESIKNFAENNYDNYVYINFVEMKEFKQIAEHSLEPEKVVKEMTLLNPSFNFKERTLIIFDEVQDYINIMSTLKFFKLQDKYDIICSGSLLGIEYSKISSVSVGYTETYEMNSMDFEEFLWAMNYSRNTLNHLSNNLLSLIPFTEIEYKTFSSLFFDYILLGGMPNIVKTYLMNNKNFSNVLNMQRELIENYKTDISKYATGLEKTKLLNVFNLIPTILSKENKKFSFSTINIKARYENYISVIQWLKDAGIINICYALKTLDFPLKGNYEFNKFKLYYNDVGLLIASLDDYASSDLRVNKNMGIYKGGLFENIIASLLYKDKFDLFYYINEKSTLEIDFIIRNQKNIIPIEVKSNTGNAKSLKELIKSKKFDKIAFGIKFSNNNLGFANNIFTIPYFMIFRLRDFIEKFDFEKFLQEKNQE